MRWFDFRCWFGCWRGTYYSFVSCPLLLKSLSAVSWQRIGCVLTAYWTGAKFATNEIPGMTHTLRYSVSGWPTGSNILSLGGPNYWKIQYNRYWLQPFAKNLIAYRVRIEALIMRIELFSILVFQQLRIEPNIRRIECVSNCVSQPSLWFPAYRNLRIETVSRDMRICVSYRGNAKFINDCLRDLLLKLSWVIGRGVSMATMAV